MSFSSIAVQWREKEAKNLRTFILYSLIASGILHAGVLALNIGRFLLTKVPDVELAPIELEIIETPKIEVAKQPEKQLAKSQSSEGGGDNSASGGGGGGNSTPIEAVRIQSKSFQSKQQVAKIVPFISKQKPIPVAAVQQDKVQQKSIPVATGSKPDVIATEVTTPDKSIVTSTKPQSPSSAFATEPQSTPSRATEPKPTAIPLPNPQSTPISEPNSTASTRSLSNDKLRELLAQGRANITKQESNNPNPASGSSINGSGNGTTAGIGNNNLISTGNGNGLGTGNGTGLGTGKGNGLGTGNGTGLGTGNGTGLGTGKGIGSGTRNGNGTGSGSNSSGTDSTIPEKPKVVVAPKPHIDTGSKLNPADCEECIIKYPERAKRRGIEGNPEVSIDYDDNGRVTNVRLSRSSGSDELDEALVSQARNFKLKPSAGGKQGVRVGANYAICLRHACAIANSQRHRELQERKKRTEQRRQQEVEAKREIGNQNPEKPTTIPKNAIITDVTPESNQRRPEDKPETVRNRRESENQQVEPKKPSRRNENNSDESEKVKPTKKSSSQRLQEILRRPTELPQLAPTTPVSEPVQTPDESKEN